MSVTFAHGNRVGLVCSILRSAGAPETESEWEAKPGLLPLWWGPTVLVATGDRVRYFVTPTGLAFEGVAPGLAP